MDFSQNSAVGALLLCFIDVTEFRHAVKMNPRCFSGYVFILIAWVR
jgi:hypothetical protein